jgi:hypothetical protein
MENNPNNQAIEEFRRSLAMDKSIGLASWFADIIPMKGVAWLKLGNGEFNQIALNTLTKIPGVICKRHDKNKILTNGQRAEINCIELRPAYFNDLDSQQSAQLGGELGIIFVSVIPNQANHFDDALVAGKRDLPSPLPYKNSTQSLCDFLIYISRTTHNAALAVDIPESAQRALITDLASRRLDFPIVVQTTFKPNQKAIGVVKLQMTT